MAETQAENQPVFLEEAPGINRRYVGTKETVGFVLLDAAANINFLKDNEEFTSRAVGIDQGRQALFKPLLTAWDIINDLFVASIVDRTRTRFGKFRPYLFAYPFYSVPVAIVYYLLPFLFPLTDGFYWPKVILWAIMKMLNDLSFTMYEVSKTGMIANITPNPEERLRMITKAQFFSMFGEDLPKQVFKILRDVISASAADALLREQGEAKMRTLFLVFGIGMMIISSCLAMYFALVSKERVLSSNAAQRQPLAIRETLRAVKNNRPLLMLMLSEILDGFQIKRQTEIYETSVLDFSNLSVVAGIPGAPISYLSYAYVPWLRRHFSTKFLWILGTYIEAPSYILIYLFGLTKVKEARSTSYGPDKAVRRLHAYRFYDLPSMIIAFGLKITADMTLYGTKKIIPEEIRNECIDYGEWKNGFRTEGMTGALKGISKKVTEMFGSTISNAVLKAAGFDIGADYKNQSASVAKTVFALATILPTVTSLLSILPKLFYNINKKDRERMYTELAERRALAGAEIQGLNDS